MKNWDTKRFFLTFDTSELERYIDKLQKASKNKSLASRYSKSISPVLILRKSAPTAISELIRYTPSGDEGSNWGYWNYGSYALYGGDHSKNTLKRGWATKLPSQAEYKAFWTPTLMDITDFVDGNVFVKRSSNNTHYVNLENCLEYAVYVNYGHHVVLPGEAGTVKYSPGISRYQPIASKGTAVGRWVPGKYFVERMPKRAWNSVSDKIHEEYLKQLKEVLKND